MGPYYLILITKRRQVGTICDHAIYGIEESQIHTIPDSTVQTEASNSKAEMRFVSLKIFDDKFRMIIWIIVVMNNFAIFLPRDIIGFIYLFNAICVDCYALFPLFSRSCGCNPSYIGSWIMPCDWNHSCV